ncbi:MAG: MBL fold metallo-hydrolase [Gemmatimonadaceae bacterium]
MITLLLAFQLQAAVLDTAIARMGGADSLRAIQRARFEMLTQWQRTAFDGRPYADQPNYEQHSELRDYTIDAWRNSRRFGFAANAPQIADVVRDTVAIRRSPGGPGGVASPGIAAPGQWAPLNIAYVQEKNELFAVAPERLLLGARSARDLRALPDTSIAGAAHARVSATVGGFPMTIFVRRSTGFLTMARFTTNEDADFGLTPWGDMEVEYWYSSWRRYPNGLVYPAQFDVRRVGTPYKRMSILSATFNPAAMPDSFAVSDSLRSAWYATSRKAMHDVPFDSAKFIGDGHFATFGAPGAPAGAVKVGSKWVMLEGGQAPMSAERASAFLGGAPAAAFVTIPSTGSGGAAWLATHGATVHVAPGAAPFVKRVFRGQHAGSAKADVVSSGRWIRIAGDSVRVEPVDLADAPGAMVVYVPSLEYVYSGLAALPHHMDRVRALAKARGWKVTRWGNARSVLVP